MLGINDPTDYFNEKVWFSLMSDQSVSNILKLSIKVTPKSRNTEFIGWEGETLRMRLAAIPEKGNANHTLVRFLSRAFGIAISNITIISGETSRIKRLLIKGMTIEQVRSVCP